jgi:hypothetical protein
MEQFIMSTIVSHTPSQISSEFCFNNHFKIALKQYYLVIYKASLVKTFPSILHKCYR